MPSARDRALRSLRALVDVLYHSARAIEARTGLTNAQLAILRLVAHRGPMTVSDVSARMRAGQSTVSTILGRLTHAGLVGRKRARDDARVAVVHVTAAGRRKLANSPRPPTERLIAAVANTADADAERLATALEALLRGMRVPLVDAPLLFD